MFVAMVTENAAAGPTPVLAERARSEGMRRSDQGIPVLPQRAASEGPGYPLLLKVQRVMTAAIGIPRSPRLKKGAASKRSTRSMRAIGVSPTTEDKFTRFFVEERGRDEHDHP